MPFSHEQWRGVKASYNEVRPFSKAILFTLAANALAFVFLVPVMAVHQGIYGSSLLNFFATLFLAWPIIAIIAFHSIPINIVIYWPLFTLLSIGLAPILAKLPRTLLSMAVASFASVLWIPHQSAYFSTAALPPFEGTRFREMPDYLPADYMSPILGFAGSLIAFRLIYMRAREA